MDAALKLKWLEALCSKKYKQGRQRLRNGKNEFCPIGVLCNTFDDKKWSKEEDKWNGGYQYDGSHFRYCPSYFNIDDKHTDEIMLMNDKDDCDFDEIAEYIENNIPTESKAPA